MKAISGNAYVLAPAFILDDEVKRGDLVPILTDMELLDYSAVYAVYPQRLTSKNTLFFDAMWIHRQRYSSMGSKIWLWHYGIKFNLKALTRFICLLNS